MSCSARRAVPTRATCASGSSCGASASRRTMWRRMRMRAVGCAAMWERSEPSPSWCRTARSHRSGGRDADAWSGSDDRMTAACSIRVRGVVQGVGFRPFVYRLARANTLNGWVLNAEEGVEIHLEGAETGLEAFVRDLKAQPPPAASIAGIDVRPAEATGLHEFTTRTSQRPERPTVRISADLPVCDECLKELFDPADPRYWYPYINCT